MCDYDTCKVLTEFLIAQYGKIDVLINNAGITNDATFAKMSIAQWRTVIETNLLSLFNTTHDIYENMRQNGGGSIINISSVIGQKGAVGQTNYAASKAGVIGFTKSLAQEGAKYGITVNAIAPGFVATDMVTSMPQSIQENILRQIPFHRFAKPSEIAELAFYLSSDNGKYITGQVLGVNGGLY